MIAVGRRRTVIYFQGTRAPQPPLQQTGEALTDAGGGLSVWGEDRQSLGGLTSWQGDTDSWRT